MKQRILTTVIAVLCSMVLLSMEIAPVHAYAPPNGEGDAVIQAEEVRWYYRTRDGVEEMRLWSLTRGIWLTDWIPVPDGWEIP